MHRRFIAGLLACALISLGFAQDSKPASPGAKAEQAPGGASGAAEPTAPEDTPQQKEVRASAEAMIADLNAKAADKLAGRCAEDAEIIDDEGGIHRGKATIRQLFEEFGKSFPNATTAIDIQSIQMIGNDVAVLQGLKTTENKDDGSVAGHQITAVFRKSDGKWLLASLREVADDPDPTPKQKLKPLEWLIGEWVDESADVAIDAKVRWSDDGNYILGDYSVKRQGQKLLSTSQRIGWDPIQQKVRSWHFDSDGGFGEGIWTSVGDAWIVKMSGTTSGGEHTSATFSYTRMSEDRFVWRAVDRIIGNELEEDREVVVVRKPPPPGTPGEGATK